MKSVLLFLVVLFAISSSQDVPVGKDLLGKPTTDVEYDDDTSENGSEEKATVQDSTWNVGGESDGDTSPPENLCQIPTIKENCNVQTPPKVIPKPVVIVPPIINSKVDPVEREETLICPVGTVQIGSVCSTTHSNECPEGYTYNGKRCVIKFTNCPLNFELKFGRCVERQICPQNYVLRNNRCEPMTKCPAGWRWNGERCEVIRIECQPGSVLLGDECVVENFACPYGTNQIGDRCVEPTRLCPPGFVLKKNGFCSRETNKCPPMSIMVNGECRKTTIKCPKGSYQIGNQCYKSSTCPAGYELIDDTCHLINVPSKPGIECNPPFVKIGRLCYIFQDCAPQPDCRDGFVKINGACYPISTTPRPPPRPVEDCVDGYYRVGIYCYPKKSCISEPTTPKPQPLCPEGYYWYVDRCVRIPRETPTMRPITTTAAPPYESRDRCSEGFIYQNNKCYRCPPSFDLCENKCIKSGHSCGPINYPNININMYTRENRAPGNSHNVIHHIEPINNTIINMNNISNPVTLHNVNTNNIYVYNEVQCRDGSIKTVVVKNNETTNGCIDMDVEDKKTNEKCCQIVTPRQCQKKADHKWMCNHRRYDYCGKYCIADRLYLKPPATSYVNNILTMVPSQPVHNTPPCFGRNCPSYDCSGCINGSFNCASNCYTYPCNHAGCHYLNEQDFCSVVGGEICEPDRYN